MLINNHEAVRPDEIAVFIAHMSGRDEQPSRVIDGVYLIGHFGGSHVMQGYEHYPNLEDGNGEYFGSYGVCDNYSQILDKCPELLGSSDREFTITLTEIRRDSEPPDGGWRWHKWGEYIGSKTPTREYLHDEPDIDVVFVYHIYEKRTG